MSFRVSYEHTFCARQLFRDRVGTVEASRCWRRVSDVPDGRPPPSRVEHPGRRARKGQSRLHTSHDAITTKRSELCCENTVAVAALAAAFGLGLYVGTSEIVSAKSNRIREIRTYTTAEGKLDSLVKRMGEHEKRMFEKHGMKTELFSVAAATQMMIYKELKAR